MMTSKQFKHFLQTGLVPLVEDFFKWNEFDISLFYSGAGITVSCP